MNFGSGRNVALLFNSAGTAEREGLTALEGILSGNGYVIFIGVVNMMVRKCMINGRTVTPNACLSWPDF